MTAPVFNKLPFRQRIWLTIAATAVLLGLGGYFGIARAIETIGKLRMQVGVAKLDASERSRQEQNLAVMTQRLEAIEPELKKIDALFVSPNQELEFITTLEGIANNHQVEQQLNLKIDDAEKTKNVKKVPLDITVSGPYDKVLRYLKALESLRYLITVNSVQMNIAQDSGAGGRYTLRLTGISYWK